LFTGYILLVVPVLYFILKKVDKREWAWLVIPALAVITSVGLYVVGAQDRLGDYKTKAVSIVSVNKNGEGYGKGSVSMLSKESGTYALEVDTSLQPFPTNTRRSTNMRAKEMPYIETGNDTNRVYFEEVEFWSPRKDTSQDNIHLVTQPVDINLGSGNKSVSTELRNPTLTTVEGQVRYNGLGRGDLMIDADQGTYLFKYSLPEAYIKQGFEVNELSLNFQKRPGGVSYAIYNTKVDAYDSIEDASFDQNVQETYIEENTITIRATVTNNNMNEPIFVPSINVKGVTNP